MGKHDGALRAGLVSAVVLGMMVCSVAAPAVAATTQDVSANLSQAFNQDAVATPGTATKGGTSLDTKGDSFDAAGWPTNLTFTTSTFATASGGATKGAPVTFTLPPASNTAFNAIMNSGQTVALPAGHYQEIYFLGAATWGPAAFPLVLQYHNGSSSTLSATWADWFGPADASAAVIQGKSGTNPVGFYAFSYPVDPSHTLTGVKLPATLPTHNGGPQAIHIFAISLLPTATATATATASATTTGSTSVPKTGMPASVPALGVLLLVAGMLLSRRSVVAGRRVH